MKEGFLIGEFSRQVNISPQTIRYYERLGLLTPPKRNTSQYRVYLAEDEQRLRFIQQAKRFGLSLDEIKRLIQIRTEGVAPCTDLKTMVKQHLDELDQHIQEMLTLRREIAQRYERIESFLSNHLLTSVENNCNSRVCQLIEEDNEQHQSQNDVSCT